MAYPTDWSTVIDGKTVDFYQATLPACHTFAANTVMFWWEVGTTDRLEPTFYSGYLAQIDAEALYYS